MSGIPLSYWTGLGADVPAGRADPAACARLLKAYKLYQAWDVQAKAGNPNAPAERDRYKSEWEKLKSQSACRDAPATSVPSAPSASSQVASAPRPADGPGRIQVPTVQPIQRGPFGFQPNLQPLSQVVYGPQQPQQPVMTINQVPTWLWVVAGTATALLAFSALKKSRSR